MLDWFVDSSIWILIIASVLLVIGLIFFLCALIETRLVVIPHAKGSKNPAFQLIF